MIYKLFTNNENESIEIKANDSMTIEEMGSFLNLLIMLGNMTGIKVSMDSNNSFMVQYLKNCHTHLSPVHDSYQDVWEKISNIAKEQDEYNNKNVEYYSHEQLQEKGMRISDLLCPGGKQFVVMSEEQYSEYRKMVEFLKSGIR